MSVKENQLDIAVQNKLNLEVQDGGSPVDSAVDTINLVGGTVTNPSPGTIQLDLSALSGGSSGNVNDMLNDAIKQNSAYEAGLTVGTTNTVEGLLSSPSTNVNFDGFAEIETGLIHQIDTVNTNVDIVVDDGDDNSAEYTNGDILYLIKSDTINGVTAYAIQKEVTITGSSHSAGQTTFTISDTSDILVNDFVVKKGLITHEQSNVTMGSANSFSTMNEDGVLKIISVDNSAPPSQMQHYWDLGSATSGSEPFSVATNGPNLNIVGTGFSTPAGLTTATANANTGWNVSNYLVDAEQGGTVGNSILAGNWQQTWSCSGWYYHATAFSGSHAIIGNWQTQGWRLWFNTTNVRITGGTTGFDTTENIPSASFTVGAWHFITINHRVDTNSRWQVMVNGVQTAINDVFTSTADLVGNATGSSGFFRLGFTNGNGGLGAVANARYDEFFFFDRLVPLAEHQTYYNSGTGAGPFVTAATVQIDYSSAAPSSGQKIASKITTVKTGTPKIDVKKHGIVLE